MKTWSHSLAKAIGFELIQHGRNRFAIGLVLGFIPFWLSLVDGIVMDKPLGFAYQPEHRVITVLANQLTQITAADNAVSLIVGFMMFATTFRAGDFDQRLALAGFPRSSLLLAKLAALFAIAAVVATYAWGIMCAFHEPERPWLLLLSLFACGLTYGGIGVVLGVAVHTELAGMFLIIMLSLVDVMVQNPLLNPSSGSDALRMMPSYGSMQSGVAGAFTRDVPVEYLMLGPAWLGTFTLFGLVAFYVRTRDHARRTSGGQMQQPQAAPRPAVVVVTPREDGTLAVKSSTGPVVLCSRLASAPQEPAAELVHSGGSCGCP